MRGSFPGALWQSNRSCKPHSRPLASRVDRDLRLLDQADVEDGASAEVVGGALVADEGAEVLQQPPQQRRLPPNHPGRRAAPVDDPRPRRDTTMTRRDTSMTRRDTAMTRRDTTIVRLNWMDGLKLELVIVSPSSFVRTALCNMWNFSSTSPALLAARMRSSAQAMLFKSRAASALSFGLFFVVSAMRDGSATPSFTTTVHLVVEHCLPHWMAL